MTTNDLEASAALSEAIQHTLCEDHSYAMGLPCVVTIRDATAQDRTRFREMYALLLGEEGARGSYLATERNIDFFMTLFDAFVCGQRDGIALIVDEGACVLWGDIGLNDTLDTSYGRAAAGLGTYIAPMLRGKGLAGRLWAAASEKIRAKGFDVVVGSVPNGNLSSIRALEKLGVIPTDIQFLIDVKRF